MRIALAILMALHGVAHLVGFAGSWGLMRDAPRTSTLLGGRIDIGERGLRPYGVLWLTAAVVFLIAAVAAATDQDWWMPVTVAVAVLSLLLSILSWPFSRIGVFVNVVILAVVFAGSRLAWF